MYYGIVKIANLTELCFTELLLMRTLCDAYLKECVSSAFNPGHTIANEKKKALTKHRFNLLVARSCLQQVDIQNKIKSK